MRTITDIGFEVSISITVGGTFSYSFSAILPHDIPITKPELIYSKAGEPFALEELGFPLIKLLEALGHATEVGKNVWVLTRKAIEQTGAAANCLVSDADAD